MPNDVFVEMECFQLCHDGEIVCGDDFLFERLEQENRHLAVLSDGLGSGIKANLLACMTTTMALEFVRSNMDVLLSAEIIMDTLPVCEVRRISYATFSIFDLQIGGKSRIIEMDNPPFIHLRNGKDLKVSRQSMVSERWPDRRVQLAEIYAITGDRLIAFSDGVAQAGLGQPGCKFGWRREGALEFIQAEVAKDPAISARELSQRVVYAARNHNKDNRCIDDISCMVIYLRKPRRLRLLTGPPFRPESDTAYAELVRNFDGKIILSGGTTANIVSRELKRPIDVDMKLVMKAGNLPPPARMEGVDLVSEGILTLTDVVQRLEADPPLTTPVPLAAKQMIDLFRESDEIEFVVGTKVNEAHQDPSLPMDLEIRRNIVRRLKTVLENKYRKRVLMRYF
ncbi:SpoIIE family protein phosphatase [uncultured Victivallis sp.]|uniref:SpoIIE family protein phosphatase n=1 Tax=uncultured Victivallis sp. TaxID=354118 RepID=UPI0025CDF987|nr:SpoIIE family protein phosphatase [uncultured Victivallis sp.]